MCSDHVNVFKYLIYKITKFFIISRQKLPESKLDLVKENEQ